MDVRRHGPKERPVLGPVAEQGAGGRVADQRHAEVLGVVGNRLGRRGRVGPDEEEGGLVGDPRIRVERDRFLVVLESEALRCRAKRATLPVADIPNIVFQLDVAKDVRVVVYLLNGIGHCSSSQVGKDVVLGATLPGRALCPAFIVELDLVVDGEESAELDPGIRWEGSWPLPPSCEKLNNTP